MFGRSKPSRTHTQQMWDELMESYDHLKQAVGLGDGRAVDLFPVCPPSSSSS